jgi:hypothetical protein
MDVKVMIELENIVNDEKLGWNLKDGKALDFINKLPIPMSQVHLRLDYKNYYFAAKKDKRDDEHGYGHGV